MQVHNVCIKAGQYTHSLPDSVWNIMQLQIEKDFVPAPFDLAHDSRSLRIIKLHPDLDERLFL